jgi:uncharacterized protein involved in outer membrane biogenesis
MMHRAIIILSWVAGALVVLLLALAIVAMTVDADAYRPRLERELTHLLGRKVSAGHLSIGFSLHPTLSVKELRVENPSWGSRPYFFTAGNVELTLDLIELLYGRVAIDTATVRGLDLLLEQGADGVGNWEFGDSAAASGDGGVQLPDFEFISLRDASFTWRGISGEPVNVSIESADARMRADKPFELETDFSYRQVAIAADLKSTASLQTLLDGQALAASIALRSGDARADLEVTAPRLSELGAASINFSGKGKRLDALSELAQYGLPEWGPYRVSGTARFSGGGVQVSNLRMLVEGLAETPSLPVSRIEIDSGDVSVERTAATSLQLAGKIDENSFRLDLTTADPVHDSDGTGSIALAAKVEVDDFALAADGTISRAANLLSFDLATNVQGDVGVPARLFGASSLIHPLRVDLSGRVSGDASRIAAEGLRGTIASCSVAGDLAIRRTERHWIGGTLELGRLDLAAFGVKQDDGVSNAGDKPSQESEPPSAAPGWMRAFDADLQLQVETVVGLPVALSGLSARGTLQDGKLRVHGLRGVVNKTSLFADGGLQWKDRRPYMDAKIRVPLFEVPNPAGTGKATGGSGNDKHERSAGRLDERLPLALLRLFDADITLETGRIKGLPVSITNQRGSATLRRGRLRVPRMNATLADVPFRGSLIVDASSNDTHLSATVSAGDFDVASVLKKIEVDSVLEGKVGQPSATVDTHGITLRDWIRNAKVSARVEASALKRRDHETELTMQRASLIAGPGVNALVESRGELGEFPFDLTLTGGPLADLLEGKQAWPKVVADMRMAVRENTFNVTASSALDALRRGRDVPVRIDVRSNNAYALAQGTIADLREPARSPLDVQVNVKSLASLPPLANRSLLPDMPFAAAAKAVLDEELFSLEQLVIRAGETDLSGRAQLHRKDRIKLVLELSGNLIDLRPWDAETVEKIPEDERIARLDRPFDLDALRNYDAELQLKARRVIGRGLELDDFNLQSTLASGLLKASVRIAEGGGSATLQVDARRDIPVVGLDFSTTNLDRDTLLPEGVERRYKDAPRISVRVQLAAQGTTPREMYASSRGDILLNTGSGRVRTVDSPLWYEAISSDLLETLTPGKKPEDYNSLECAAAYFKIADGVASSPDGIALRFKRMDLLGSGAANLSTREILFGFKAVRRKWWSFSILELAGDFATIRGTIEQPKVGLSPEDVIVQGGAAWATLGLSILATNFFRKLNAAEDPCAQIVEKGHTASTPIDDLLKSMRLRRSN